MKETHTWTKPRSNELKNLDAAILDYNNSQPPGRDAKFHHIRQVLKAWKDKEGSHWMRSVRNETGIITALDNFLNGVPAQSLNKADLDAWKLVCDAARDNCKNMLKGKKLTVKKTVIGGTLFSIGTTAQSAYSAVDTARKVATGATHVLSPSAAAAAVHSVAPTAIEHAAHGLLKACFDVADIKEVMDALGPAFKEVMKAMTPFLGMVTGGLKGAYAWIKVINQGWEQHKLPQIKDAKAFAVGDPAAAFDAVLVIIKRNLEAQIGDASILTAAFGLQTGLFFADGGVVSGPVVGAASAIAQLLSQIIQFARDSKEVKNGNEQLANGPWDFTLFKTCPILGCYLIACSDTSAVINLAVDQFGSYQWVDKIEMLKSKADPAIDKAGDLIRDSRYEIVELRQSKGVVKPHPKVFGYNPFKQVGGAVADVQRGVQRMENAANKPIPNPFSKKKAA
jgi:hypothetical protein